MLGAIQDIGALVGIASFVVMLGLLGLYVMRAREIRQIRRHAPFLANAGNGRPSNGRSRRAERRRRRRAGGG